MRLPLSVASMGLLLRQPQKDTYIFANFIITHKDWVQKRAGVNCDILITHINFLYSNLGSHPATIDHHVSSLS